MDWNLIKHMLIGTVLLAICFAGLTFSIKSQIKNAGGTQKIASNVGKIANSFLKECKQDGKNK
jgi:hypothetical protein